MRKAAEAGIRIDVVPLDGPKPTAPMVTAIKPRAAHVAEHQPIAFDVDVSANGAFQVVWTRDGVPMPPVVADTTLPAPQTSYGTHKLMCEYLIADYTRKGYIDGRSARLMTVTVRPGKPNGAASSFFSGIIREPLAGVEAICPVSPDASHPVSSPGRTVDGLIAVFEASREALKGRLNPQIEIEGVLRTMFDVRNNLANAVSAELTNHFGELVFRTIIPRNVRLAEAPSHGQSIVGYDRASRGGVAYLGLAGEVIRRQIERERGPARPVEVA